MRTVFLPRSPPVLASLSHLPPLARRSLNVCYAVHGVVNGASCIFLAAGFFSTLVHLNRAVLSRSAVFAHVYGTVCFPEKPEHVSHISEKRPRLQRAKNGKCAHKK